ncbi:BnaCnng61790D, partial [Brassica napus]
MERPRLIPKGRCSPWIDLLFGDNIHTSSNNSKCSNNNLLLSSV